MVDRFDGVPYSFGVLRKTFGPLYLRCDVCRRYAHLYCGADATLTVTDPKTETGMCDYRLDQLERPQRHPCAIARLSGERRQMNVDQPGGEVPGHNLVGHR